MPLAYIGSLSLPGLVPSVWLSVGNVSAGLSADLQGNLALAANFTASPPTIATQLAASLQWTENVTQAIAALPPVPNFSFSISDTVALQASFTASLNVYLPALLALLALNAGIYAFAYEGLGTSFGAAITSQLASTWPDGAPTSGTCTALVIGAVPTGFNPHAATALQTFLSGMTFGSGLVYTGKIGLPAMVPLVVGAAAQGSASIGAKVAAAAQLSAAASVTPPSFAAMLALQAKFYANLQANPVISPPSLTVSASLSAAASLQANFGASCALGAALSSGAALFVYLYTGPANALGVALTSALASDWGDTITPSNTPCTAVVLGATDAISIGALLGMFNGV